MTDRSTRSLPYLLGALLCGSSLALLGACHRSEPAPPGAPAQSGAKADGAGQSAPADEAARSKADEPDTGLALKPEEVSKLGVVTNPLKAAKHAPEASGFGVVVGHDAIAQAVADLATALAVEHQSRAVFERTRQLASTPGALPVEAGESAERQATVDRAALELARRRLSSIVGQHPPWPKGEENAQLSALASGRLQLVRVTFPFDALGAATPTRIRLAHIGTNGGAKSWESHTVWSAPADAGVPGRSFFAISSPDASEGERLIAWTPVGEPVDGVLIPASAAVISNGQFWAYVQVKPDNFVRTAFDPGISTSEGYFVTQGFEPGAQVVVTAAGQLLARELNPSTEAE